MSKLQSKQVVDIQQIGKLSMNENRLIEFIPSDTNFDRQSYGMQSIDCFPIYRKRKN